MKRWLTILSLTLVTAALVHALDSCTRPDHSPTLIQKNIIIPVGFPALQNDALITEQGFALGRKLFYDGRLSRDGDHACASCHQPVAAFTTYEHDRSHGFNHSHTLRNAPGLFNLAWYPYFNQDGGEKDLAVLFAKHVTNPNEMAEDFQRIQSKIGNDPAYASMFMSAFGSREVNEAKILNALKQFVLSLVSANSKYDRVSRGETSFTSEEQSGYALFRTNCAGCHKEPLFTDFSFRNTGFEIDPNLNDFGRMRITGLSSDSLKFRVPSLRNVEFTSYYTHDGRLSLPRHLIEHYRNGIVQSSTLDPALKSGINLTLTQENDLVAFLRTLSDSTFLKNPAYRE